jgi:SatD family protein
MDKFKDLTNTVNKIFAKNFLSPLTITLGDEFQGVLRSLQSGTEAIIGFEETIIEKNADFKLRYILNFGEIRTDLNPIRAYEMLGEGLTTAREQLDSQKHRDRRFLIRSDAQLTEPINLAFFWYQSLVDGWNVSDYELVSAFWEYKDYKKVADFIHKDRSSVWRREKEPENAGIPGSQTIN